MTAAKTKSNGASATSAPAKTLTEALIAAQAEMPAVKPDGTNPHFKSKFVKLGTLIAKVRPVLNRHGIAVSQFPSQDDQGRPTLVTILMHASGERLEYAAPLLLPKSDPQGQGSAITYMRRYALASALGISDQEDDDGNAGTAAASNGAAAPEVDYEKKIAELLAQADEHQEKRKHADTGMKLLGANPEQRHRELLGATTKRDLDSLVKRVDDAADQTSQKGEGK